MQQTKILGNTKLLIISDLHLTTNFIKVKFDYLSNLISKYDTIIINGDLWSAYYNDFDKFLSSPWKELFPLLKSKNTYYTFGNHDDKRWTDERVNLFSNWSGDRLEFETGDKTFLIAEHGHVILNSLPNSDNYIRFWSKYKFDAIKYFFESLFLRIFGRYFYLPAKLLNNKIKDYAKKLENINYLIVGHTHWAEIDAPNKFINCGLIHSGVSTYLQIIDGKPQIVYERY